MAALGELYSFSEEYIENVRLSFEGANVSNITNITVVTTFGGTETYELDANNNVEIFLNANDTIEVTANLNDGTTQSFSSESYTYSASLTLFTFTVAGTYYYDNDYNFIRWANTEGDGLAEADLSGVTIIETDIKNRNPSLSSLSYTPVFVKDETIKWYFNSAELLSTTVGNLSMFFINSSGARSSGDITGISEDVISGSDYRPYMSFTVPDFGDEGQCYRMVVWDGTNIVMISNQIVYQETAALYDKTTYKIKYRNTKNILNFGYANAGMSTYYNQVRIHLEKESPSNIDNAVGYQLVNGRFNRVRTTLNKSFNFVTAPFDSYAHDAMNAALIHSDLQIYDNGAFLRYYFGEDEYNQDEFIKGFPLTQANFRLTETGGSSNKAI